MRKFASCLLYAIAFFIISIIVVFAISGHSTDSKKENTSTAKDTINNWSYAVQTNEMNDEKTKLANTKSTNDINFKFPYNGGSTFDFGIRKNGKKDEVYIRVDKGAFMPSVMGEKKVQLKFDDNKPFAVNYIGTSDASINTIFLSSENKIISKLKSSKKLKVEAEFFQEGDRVIYFNVSGLEWK